MKSTKSPLRFLKKFKRTKKRKQPTVIYTVNSLRKDDTPSEQPHNGGGVTNDAFTTNADTQQTQLSSTFSISVVKIESDEKDCPNIAVIEEEPSSIEHPQEDNSVTISDSQGIDNDAYENETKEISNDEINTEKENQEEHKLNIGVENASFTDSGIENDNSI